MSNLDLLRPDHRRHHHHRHSNTILSSGSLKSSMSLNIVPLRAAAISSSDFYHYSSSTVAILSEPQLQYQHKLYCTSVLACRVTARLRLVDAIVSSCGLMAKHYDSKPSHELFSSTDHRFAAVPTPMNNDPIIITHVLRPMFLHADALTKAINNWSRFLITACWTSMVVVYSIRIYSGTISGMGSTYNQSGMINNLAVWGLAGAAINHMLSISLKVVIKQPRPDHHRHHHGDNYNTNYSTISPPDYSAAYSVGRQYIHHPNQALHNLGMPSSHAQSLSFLYTYWCSTIGTGLFEAFSLRATKWASMGLLLCIVVYMAWSRVKEGYHTSSQVLVGGTVGTIFASTWLACYKILFMRYLI